MAVSVLCGFLSPSNLIRIGSRIDRYFPWKRLILLCCLSVMAGCGSPYKSVSLLPSDLFQEKSRNAVNSLTPSWETKQTLRLLFLDEAYHKNHQNVLSQLEDRVGENPQPSLRKALAELALLEAQKCRDNSREKTTYYLIAAREAYDFLFFDPESIRSSPLSPDYRFMADIYNMSVSQLVDMRANRTDPWDAKDFEYKGVQYHFQVDKTGPGIWDPTWFNYLYNSYEIRVTGLANEYISRGLGAPLVGIVEKPQQNPHFGRFFPARMAAYPLSAVLLFDPVRKTGPPSRTIRLAFYDSLQVNTIAVQNHEVPLEADYSTPLGLQLRKTNPFQTGLHNLLSSDVELKTAGVYMLEPYRPDKIPVVLVHGLMSSPATWAGMFNDLRGDAQLRKRYQFWFFMYPTGLPIGYSTSILRKQLNMIHDLCDPNSANPNFNQMVLVGHSMGGLLSRGMVQDSGTAFWDYYFKEPFEKTDLDPNTKSQLKEMLFFEHLSFVKRVIFIATPHRGSPMADTWYTGILSAMVNLPTVVSDTTSKIVNRGVLTQSVTDSFMKQKTNNSLTLLSPTSNFIKITTTVPLRPDIPYHSIIGTQKAVALGDDTTDGIVPYGSSHLDFAVSEKLVPSGHGAHTHPLAIDEVKRILREHLDSIEQDKKAK